MRHRAYWASLLILSGAACGPPPTVSVMPPGVDPYANYKPKEGQEAQAAGEASTRKAEEAAAKSTGPPTKEPDTPPEIRPVEEKALPGGVKAQVFQEGTGAVARQGQGVDVHYTGWVDGGKKFDSSRERSTTFRFTLGAGDVIKGWDIGVDGMKVGERRRLTIPPDLGYGAKGSRGIPGNATLIFDVELVGVDGGVEPAPAPGETAKSAPDAKAAMPEPKPSGGEPKPEPAASPAPEAPKGV